uniref:N-terminal domain-containing protein n=1 Tax=viral metagenome TaxID=1070528 RepID=A0A6H1ZK71_9ZZZZ
MVSDKTKQLEVRLQELSNQIVTDTDKLDQFTAQWNNGFHNYSFGNTILIWAQKHDASLCAGYRTWLEKKRFVRRGEHGISILAPMIFKAKREKENEAGEVETEEIPVTRFRAVTVFDVSQTDGEPLELGHSDKVTGHTNLELDKVSKLFEYPVSYSNGIENGHTDGKSITLSERGNSTAMLATYFHELAHSMLHFGDKRKELSSQTRELEAEAVSYIVCASFGIDNQKSKYYIGNWQGNAEKMGNAGRRIIKTAEKIVRTIEVN